MPKADKRPTRARSANQARRASPSDIRAQVLEATREFVAAERALDRCPETATQAEIDALDARFSAALRHLKALADKLPSARSQDDVTLRAMVAYCVSAKTGRDGRINVDYVAEAAAVRLIEAVHQVHRIAY
jgi:hypothetical protein